VIQASPEEMKSVVSFFVFPFLFLFIVRIVDILCLEIIFEP
jgi:hypothetical protein